MLVIPERRMCKLVYHGQIVRSTQKSQNDKFRMGRFYKNIGLSSFMAMR
jgi:hypothetical protein